MLTEQERQLIERVKAADLAKDIAEIQDDLDCDYDAWQTTEIRSRIIQDDAERLMLAYRDAYALLEIIERLKARVEELERERDEALLLVEGPGTLRELANEYGRALMSEAELLARERLLARAVMSLVKHDCVNPSDYVPEVMAARAVLAPGEGTPDDERPKNTRLTP